VSLVGILSNSESSELLRSPTSCHLSHNRHRAPKLKKVEEIGRLDES
jgi:hypothetical protein